MLAQLLRNISPYNEVMQTPWRVELFGWLRVETEGHSVTRFATRKTAALLARLALWPRRAHAREELAELLWPDVDFDAARARLRQALSSLRHQLEPPGIDAGSVLITDRASVRLNPIAISTDVADFEAAVRRGNRAEAIRLYREELLPGYYEEWILEERNRLHALFEAIQHGKSAQEKSAGDTVLPELTVAQGVHSAEENASAVPTAMRLPIQFTRFFGRTEEQNTVLKLLMEHRIVTLTGFGGIGKTRLAIEIARAGADARQIVFIGLADLTEGEHVPSAIADALRLPGEETRPALERVVDALSLHPTLLLWDNAEHLVAYIAPLARTLLARVPSLKLLVASRRRLHIAGEREYSVPALPVPSEESAVDTISVSPAVQLFVDRAQAARPDFQLTPRNAADIAALCRQLEGLPLAIELAAVRVSALTPAQIRERLSDRFALLATRRTDKNARHRSLWTTIAWSVDLLPEPLQRFWRQLSPFRGGFTIEAAAAVTEEEAALEALTQLRERSLVTAEEWGTAIRFRLSESMREFAEEQSDKAEREVTEKRHGEYFLQLAQESEEALRGPEQATWLERLAGEQDNLRAALSRGIRRGDVLFSLTLAAALWGFWERRGHLREGRLELERALALPGPTTIAARAKALNRLGAILNALGDLSEAETVHRETLRLYEQLDDAKGIALAWNRLGFVAGQQSRHQVAQEAFSEALARERELGNPYNVGAALINLGVIAQTIGDYAEAHEYFTEGLGIFTDLNNPAVIADTLLNLAALHLDQGQWEHAIPLLDQAAERYTALEDRWSQSYVNLSRAAVARHQGRWNTANELAQETLRVCQEVGDQAKVADALYQLGLIARHEEASERALSRFQDALRIYQELGQNASASLCLREMAALAADRGDYAHAAQLLGTSDNLHERTGLPLSPVEQEKSERTAESIRRGLTEAAFHKYHQEGYASQEIREA